MIHLCPLVRTELDNQYLIKWKGYSHLHNTWESDQTLIDMGAKVGGICFSSFIVKLGEILKHSGTKQLPSVPELQRNFLNFEFV